MLDQGKYGACTGFGLAASVNYLLWSRPFQLAATAGAGAPRGAGARTGGAKALASLRVRPAMLYHMARVYDEWEGEEYEGSSCRGAMKGWHRHGVCEEGNWKCKIKNRAPVVAPASGWQVDAARRPLSVGDVGVAKICRRLKIPRLKLGCDARSARIRRIEPAGAETGSKSLRRRPDHGDRSLMHERFTSADSDDEPWRRAAQVAVELDRDARSSVQRQARIPSLHVGPMQPAATGGPTVQFPPGAPWH